MLVSLAVIRMFLGCFFRMGTKVGAAFFLSYSFCQTGEKKITWIRSSKVGPWVNIKELVADTLPMLIPFLSPPCLMPVAAVYLSGSI